MFKYNNAHIFTGYLKQLLSSFNLPMCRVYTQEFANYLAKHGTEDPRVLCSFDSLNTSRLAARINYLKNNEIYNYFWDPDVSKQASWRRVSDVFYDKDQRILGLTKTLNSPGSTYDTTTHEYLGNYLRFIRDYYDVNLMSLYNCFNNKIFNNIYFNFIINPDAEKEKQIKTTFNTQEPGYYIYAVPVKLFAEYTIAIDCSQSIEMFCGLYNTNLDVSGRAKKLAAQTYKKINKSFFNQPFIYDKLNTAEWQIENDFTSPNSIRTDIYTHWDIASREDDLRLFIKVPVSCKSSITILEGDFRTFNNFKYSPIKYKPDGTVFKSELEQIDDETKEKLKAVWTYQQNYSVLNFNTKKITNNGDGLDLNNYKFKPICKLQLLAFNTGESYPYADRLIEYLSGSAITAMEEIPDNIRRVQRVMEQNKNYFSIEGLWENKMQNILYDSMINSGPIKVVNNKLKDERRGYNYPLGRTSKSMLFDILGYVDKDAEKWYASWERDKDKPKVKNIIQNVDIYDGLYDI